MSQENWIEAIIGAAIGYGVFVGWTKNSIKMIGAAVQRIEAKLDRMDSRIDIHDVALASLPCVDGDDDDCPRVAVPPVTGFLPILPATAGSRPPLRP